jgi:iron(III) transport system substrate-binding protein
LTIYTVLASEVHEVYLPAFQGAHPEIKLNIVADLTGNITERLIAEKDNPQADVVYLVAATSLLRAAAEGILEPYAPKGLERVNPRMRDSNDPPLLVGTDVFMSAFCVNTELLAAKGLPMPTSWHDLTNPIYRDQIIMPDPSISAIGFIAVSAFLQQFGEEAGWGYMDALHQNINLYTKSGSGPCRLAAEGKIPIGISFGAEATTQMEKGHPVVAVFPAEGSGWEVEANALVRKNVIKPEAKVFLDWAISDPAMELYAQFFPVTSVPTKIPPPEGYAPDPLKQLIPNRFFWATANRDRITAEWVERYGEKSEAYGADVPDAFR